MYNIKMGSITFEKEDKILLKDLAKELGIEAYAAKVNNRLRELNYYLNYNCEVEFLDLRSSDAVKVYETSLRYLIIMALERLYPNIKIKFNQSVSRSISCNVSNINDKVDAKFLKKLEEEMKKIIDSDYLITRKTISKEEATKIYQEKGYLDKIGVLKYREEETVNIYECDGYVNYLYGYMVPSTGCLSKFKLHLYNPGFVVQFPRAELNGEIPGFESSLSFDKMLKDAREWSHMCECDTIPLLNEYATDIKINDLVNVCETKHNNMLASLGEKIKSDIGNIRLICIAGPSSSGKTTFSNRLRLELMSRGIKPVKISMDDYYLDRDKAPRDEYGEIDLEHVNALDLDLFNEHLLSLIQGEEVEMPSFDFKIGKRVKGEKLRVNQDTPIIIEGIHALNEEVTKLIPKYQKFKIYISPLSQINIDEHSPINATEIRLLRRVVRDSKYRKTTPTETFAMWPSVRRGEFKWIYPFQEEADFIFNSELTYELGVMKKYALPTLQAIDRNDEYFITANRLVKFLKYIRDIDDRYVPCNSLLREFIGNSCFYDV